MRKHSQRILFSLLSLSLVCLLCFSSLTINAFAEEVEADSYNIDCVPYSPYISNLTVKDNETQVVMRSTYALSAASTTSDTSTDYLYSFKDYPSLFNPGNWRPPLTNTPRPYEYPITDSNGCRGFKILFLNDDVSQRIHFATTSLPLLKAGNKYSYSFTIVQQAFTKGTMYLRFYDSTDESKYIDVFSMTAIPSSGASLKVNKTITGNIIIPENWTGSVSLRFRIENLNANEPTIYINDFAITDITNENLDKSLGKLGDRIEGFFDNLADKIKGFFIPSEGFFETIQEQFRTLLSEHLGFLYEAPALVSDIFQLISDWDPPDEPSITLPAFDFDINGTHVHLWDEHVYTFDFLSEQPWSTLYSIYKTFVFIIISVAMINLAIKKYHSIVDGGQSDDN